MVAGFVYSQILAAAVRLDVFRILADGPQSLDALAGRFDLPGQGAERLLKALVALDLAETLPDGRFALSLLGAGLRGNPGVAPMIAHHAVLYSDLADPVGLLRTMKGESLPDFWDYSGDKSGAAPYSKLMAASQPLVSAEILDTYPFGRHRRLIDVGGGSGAFLQAVKKRHPSLHLALFDLPPVVAQTADGEGNFSRISGDCRSDPLPADADLATLVRVLHDHDDGDALRILKNIRRALPTSGVLLIAEPMSDAPGARRMGDAYFGFYLAAMGRGRPRKPNEIIAMLRDAGFAEAKLLAGRMPLLAQVVCARV